MRNRTKARECALKILYAIEIRKDQPAECLRIFWEHHPTIKDEVKDFSTFLVEGVSKNKDVVDSLISKYATNWQIQRMPIFMIIGCYSLIMFIVNELLIEEPMLDLRLLKNYTFCMSNIIMNVAILALYGGVFLMPIFLQQIKGLDSLSAGLILFPEAIATAISMNVYGKFGNKIDIRIFGKEES